MLTITHLLKEVNNMNKKIFLGALLSTSAVAIATPTICATTMQNKNKTLQVNSR